MSATNVLETELSRVFEQLQPDAVQWLCDLVRIPSITGQEAAVQTKVESLFRHLSLEVDRWCPGRAELQSHPAFSDDGLPLGERPVLVGKWAGHDPSAPALILNGHVDVVPVGDEKAWHGSPWSGEVKDGCVWGRGSCDMKGGLVSGVLAVAALQEIGFKPRGNVYLQSVIGEETGGVGTLACVLRGYRAEAAIVLEPTRMNLCPVGAGAASFRMHVPGLAAHGAMRHEGVSAIEKFYSLHLAIMELEKIRNDAFHHPLFVDGQRAAPISIGTIKSGDWPSTVPESLIAEGRFGVLPGEGIGEARKAFERAIAIAADSDEWLSLHRPVVEWFEGQFESAQTPLDSRILSVLRESHTSVTGRDLETQGVPYGSDLRFFTNHAGMHAVLYGPGDVALAHSVDEHIPLDEVFRVAQVVALTITQW